MSQVTIYLEDESLAAAKEAAAAAKVSVSKWFAQFAEAQLAKSQADWDGLFNQIDGLKTGADNTAWDFLLEPTTRYAGIGQDIKRESAA